MTITQLTDKMVLVEDFGEKRIYAVGDTVYDNITKTKKIIKSIEEDNVIFNNGITIKLKNLVYFENVERGETYNKELISKKYFRIDNGVLIYKDKPINMGDLIALEVLDVQNNHLESRALLITKHKNTNKLAITSYFIFEDLFEVEYGYFDEYKVKKVDAIDNGFFVETKEYYDEVLNEEEFDKLTRSDKSTCVGDYFSEEYDHIKNVEYDADNNTYILKNNNKANIRLYMNGKAVFNFDKQNIIYDFDIEIKGSSVDITNNYHHILYEIYFISQAKIPYVLKDKSKNVFVDKDDLDTVFNVQKIIVDDQGKVVNAYLEDVSDVTIKNNDKLLELRRVTTLTNGAMNYLAFTESCITFTNGGYYPRKIYDKKAMNLIKDEYKNLMKFIPGRKINTFIFANDNYEFIKVTINKTDDRGYVTTIEED